MTTSGTAGLRMRRTRSERLPRECQECGATFTPSRPWQRFCSARCRGLHHRSPARLERLAERLDALEARVRALEAELGGTAR